MGTHIVAGISMAIEKINSQGEQHGPALPLATDAIIGRALAERVAAKMRDVLVAPAIVPGCSDHHMAWPGTINRIRAESTDRKTG